MACRGQSHPEENAESRGDSNLQEELVRQIQKSMGKQRLIEAARRSVEQAERERLQSKLRHVGPFPSQTSKILFPITMSSAYFMKSAYFIKNILASLLSWKSHQKALCFHGCEKHYCCICRPRKTSKGGKSWNLIAVNLNLTQDRYADPGNWTVS